MNATPIARDTTPIVSIDLVRESYRSDTFPHDWSREQREISAGRYAKWLELKRRHPKARMAPTRDIDLFWHLHMLSPVAYVRDCQRVFGRILDHDGGFGKVPEERDQLRQVFEQTAAWWEAEYQEPYREDGTWMRDAVQTDCWHDCSNRCWHACKNAEDDGGDHV